MKREWRKVNTFLKNRKENDLLLKWRACPFCGFTDHIIRFHLDDFQFFSDSDALPKKVDIRQVECCHCHMLFMNPCYSDDGLEILFAEAGRSYGATSARANEQVDWLDRYRLVFSGARVLDIGCYEGHFLAKLPANVEKVGVDVDKGAIARGRATYAEQGIRFIQGAFCDFKVKEKPDVITMFHVLEHLPDPVKALQNLWNNSHDKTKLVIEVPIIELGFTNDINGFFSSQHMTHFSRVSLNNCLQLAGWKIIESLEQPTYNGYRVLCSKVKKCPSSVSIDNNIKTILYKYFSHWYNAVLEVEKKIATISSPQVLIWGGGLHTELLYQLTSLFSFPNTYYHSVDSDPLKQGCTWRGLQITAPVDFKMIDWTRTIMVISSYGGTREIRKAASILGIPEKKQVYFYDDDFRLY